MKHSLFSKFNIRKITLSSFMNKIFGVLCPLFVALFLIIIPISCSTDSQDHQVSQQSACDIILPHTVDSLKTYIQKFEADGNIPCLVSSYNELGLVYHEKNRFARAVVAYLKGLEIAQTTADTLNIVHFLNAIGENCLHMSDYSQASFYYYKTFVYSKSFSKRDEQLMLEKRVASLVGIGKVFVKQENWLMADSAFHQALDCEQLLDRPTGKAACFLNLGYVYESTNELDSAWDYYRKAMIQNVESKYEYGMAKCHLHFGNLYEKAGNLAMALREYFWANELLNKNGEKWHRIESCINIARIYNAQNDGPNMFLYLEQAKKLAKETKSTQYFADIYQLYYKWYKLHGNNKLALENYELSMAYADSVMSLAKLNRMYNMRLQFMQGDHLNELRSMTSNYTNEKDQRRMLIIYFVLSSLVVTVVIITLLRILQTKRKMAVVMRKMECIRSDFFTNITHEFRTPLSVILGLSEQLENSLTLSKSELQKMGSVISYQGNQLLDLVNQLLDVSKIQSSLGTPRWCRGNIITYIDMLVGNFQGVVQKKHIELVFLSREKQVDMDFISDYMDKIIGNLMSNAYKFTPEYGKIYITASAEKGNIVIYVADTGQGISDADRPHIFDPFYQGDNKSFSVGTGIGLSLVHQLVTAMQGTIEVKSSKDKGTVFILKFPLRRKYTNGEEFNDYSATVNKNRQNVAVDSTELPKGKDIDDVTPLVLIVEDNADVAYYIGTQLHQRFTLKYARNGKVGLELAEELVPDVIITDVLMPEMDGYSLCRAIRASKQLNHIPIIIISVLNSEEERIRGQEAGADAYLCKPFNSKELNERLAYLLEQRRMLRQKYSQEQEEKEVSSITEADQLFLNKLTDITYSVMSSGNVTVEDIASKMLMSRQQINRKVHALTGENTVNYIMRIRLNRAKILLDSPNEYLIGDIATECGFEDVAYFSRTFKKMYNLTPSQYRKRVKD